MKKKVVLFVFLILLATICYISFCSISRKDVDDIIYIANYGYIPEKEKYIELVTKKWEELGHNSKLVFEDWDCYENLPEDKYDIYVYDAAVYKALRECDMLEKMDNIDTSYTFDWALNLLEDSKDIYGVPFLLCSDFLIYNKEKVNISNVNLLEDIPVSFTTAYKSMVLNYYLTAMLSQKDDNIVLDIKKGNYDENILGKLYNLIDKMDYADYINSSSSTYTGKEKMNSGVYDSMYGFSEAIYDLKDIAYTLDIVSVPLVENANCKVYYTDLISMKNDITVDEEKLYTELIEVMTSEDVNYSYVYNAGNYLYLLSANKKVLKHLANEDRLYSRLYEFVLLDTNRVFLYDSSYYTEFSQIKDDLKSISNYYMETKNSSR